MKKKWNILICLCLLLVMAHAQIQLTPTVLTNSGGSSESGALIQEWTLGEIMVETFSNSNLQLGQGFHQGYPDVGDFAYEAPGLTIDIQVLPNPVSFQLSIFTDAQEPLDFQMMDLTGRVVLQQNISGSEAIIDVSALPGALYFLRVLNQKGLLLKTFRILKTTY